jgi:tRNA(fMet)-specific endonuclease VapC
MIFLDSDIISYYLSANTKVKEKIIEAIDVGEDICITVMNVYEILKGFKWRNNGKKEYLYNNFLKDTVVLNIDDNVINIASSIYANLRKNGKIIEDTDILIAAIVMRNKGILVSNNTKHYENIEELALVNWSV